MLEVNPPSKDRGNDTGMFDHPLTTGVTTASNVIAVHPAIAALEFNAGVAALCSIAQYALCSVQAAHIQYKHISCHVAGVAKLL